MATGEDDIPDEGGSYDIPPEAVPSGVETDDADEGPADYGSVPPQPRDHRLKLIIDKGVLHNVADESVKVIATKRPPMIFTWGDVLAHIVHSPDPLTPQEVAPAPRIFVFDEHGLAESLNRLIAYHEMRLNKLTGEFEPRAVDCPATMVKWIRSRGQWPQVLPLAGIREAPTLLPSGRMISKPGYDLPSGLFLSFDANAFPQVPLRPTKDDAIAALSTLNSLLVGFPFCADFDRSALLASIISGVTRSAFPQAPLFLSISPVQSSGKSTAAGLPSLVASGRPPMSISPGRSDEEADKRILAAFLAGRSFVTLDNLIGEFELAAVARAITESTYAGRVLGISKTVDLPTTATLWTGSGNNVIPRGDLVSRTIPIRLDPKDARPWLLKRPNRSPRLVAVERRPEFVVAALTIVRAYLAAECPDMHLSGFRLEEWSGMVRAPLVWLDQPDPLEGMRLSEERDPAVEQLRELFEAWRDRFAFMPATVSQAVDASITHSQLQMVLRTISRSPSAIDPRKVGRYIAAHEDRIVDGCKFHRAGMHGAAVRWCVEAVETSVSSVSEVQFAPTRARDEDPSHAYVGGDSETYLTDLTDQQRSSSSQHSSGAGDGERDDAAPDEPRNYETPW